MTSKTMVVPTRNDLIVAHPKPDHSIKNLVTYNRIMKRIRFLVAASLIAGGVALVDVPITIGLLVQGALDGTGFENGIITLLVGVLTAALCGVAARKAFPLVEMVNDVKELESQRLRKLMYAHFGDQAGIHDEIIAAACSNSYDWQYKGVRFIVQYNKATGLYSFSKHHAVTGSLIAIPLKVPAQELQMLISQLNSFNARLSEPFLQKIIVSASKISQLKLNVEQEHSLKRILVDCVELSNLYEELSLFDEGEAERKLRLGLEKLEAEMQQLTEDIKVVSAQKMDTYNDYVGSRSS